MKTKNSVLINAATKYGMILGEYAIIPSSSLKATHNYFSIPEDLCKKMCTEHDAGERYTKSSRYTYSTKYVSDDKGIQLGPRAAVQLSIKAILGDVQHLYIEKIV